MGLIPGSGRCPREGHGNQLQYSCLENPMDRGAWWATVHGAIESWTQLSMHALHYLCQWLFPFLKYQLHEDIVYVFFFLMYLFIFIFWLHSMWDVSSPSAAAKSFQSCPTLCDPIDGSPPGSPCPWDSPGKTTGMGCHFLLQCMKVKSESEVAQSCLTLSDPMDCSLRGSSIHGIFQARVLE